MMLLPWSIALIAPASAAAPASGAWLAQVQGQVADAQRAFLPTEEGFAARGAQGARADADRTWLEAGDDEVGIRLRAMGRAELTPVDAAPPVLGACTNLDGPDGDCIRRLERHADGITEWWVGGPDGLQQGWTVDSPLEGSGALVLDLEVEGATVDRVETDSLWLDTEGGEALQVAGLSAWDADGRALPVQFRAGRDGFEVVVDDSGARYPIEVDPVYTPAELILEGSANSYLGVSVAGAGDVDGDGYDDLLVGSVGSAYLYLGSSSGPSSTADTTLTGSNYFGASVSGAGDVNGDGYDDIVVGAYYGAGKAYIYLGSATGLSTTAATTLSAASSGTYFGFGCVGLGDVDGDGYDDVAVAAWYYSSLDGQVTVYHGSASGLSSTATTTLTGASNAGFGLGISAAGDVNGDGYRDLLVGAYYTSYRNGAAYVYHGSKSGISSTAATSLTGSGSASFGWGVASLRDVDGDGYDDIAVGTPFTSGAGVGQVTVYYGSAAGIDTSSASTLAGPSGAMSFGYSIAGVDVDDDGYGDMLVGAPHSSSSAGTAYLYAGSASGFSSTPTTSLAAESTYEVFGLAVASTGDVNRDGYEDIVVGAEYYGDDAGRAYMYLGYGTNAPDLDDDGFAADVDCDDDNEAVNPDAAEVCDSEGLDEDCDGLIDDDDPSVTGATVSACLDADGDGAGGDDCGSFCELPSGWSTTVGDCDDDDSAVHPDAAEVCDDLDVDEDCDDLADDDDSDVTGQSTLYVDADLDGFGSTTTVTTCESGAGTSATSDDCDDTDATVNPDATDTPGNGIDEDCSGSDADDGAGDSGAADGGESDSGATPEEEPGCAGGCSASGSGRTPALAWLFIAVAFARRRRSPARA